MNTPANALNHPDPLLQTVVQSDVRSQAMPGNNLEPSGTDVAPVPEFRMVCQPICRIADRGGPAWVEMLIRGTGACEHKTPMEIVRQGYAHSGLDFDLMVLDAALTAAATLKRDTRIGVNIRPCSLGQPGFIRALQEMLRRRRIAPGRLVLELVECYGPVLLERTRQALHRLRRMQILIALDDFGPGHPNLDVLGEGLVDFVKLDRSLVTAMERSPRQTGVLRGIVALAEGTGVELVAEGIETCAQMNTLRRLGIGWMQGFLLGRPAALQNARRFSGEANGYRKPDRWIPSKVNNSVSSAGGQQRAALGRSQMIAGQPPPGQDQAQAFQGNQLYGCTH